MTANMPTSARFKAVSLWKQMEPTAVDKARIIA